MRPGPAKPAPQAVALSRLTCDERPPDQAVAFARSGEWQRGELADEIGALAGGVAAAGGGRWLVACESPRAAAAALLGIARAGAVAVLPPNRQPETLRRLAREVDGMLGDGGSVPQATPLAPAPLERDAPWLELHSSGTTGGPSRCTKRVRHLEDEVATLEQVLGAALPAGARVFSSVPHHHIYGLLFRVLWPLAAGRPFQSENLLHGRELASRMQEASAAALVTTPVQLRHLAAGGDLSRVRGRCCAVFSSGAPLDADTAKQVTEQLGVAPVEILGSTETGGVAVRQQSLHGDSWSPLPGVRIARDVEDRLVVTSPFVSEGEPAEGESRSFRTGDRVEIGPDGAFRLLGRADRDVKIGGKRLSLPAMERALETHPFVGEAALAASVAGKERVAAAIALSAEGRAALERTGRSAVGRALADHLGSFDPVLRPRLWRYVDELPRNAQGKLPREALEALFAAEPVRRIARQLAVAADLPCLDGHFAGHPVVPGVAQLGWALEAAEELLGSPPRVEAVEALKFPALLRPGDRPELSVEVEGEQLRFTLRQDERIFASGRCRLAADPEESE